MVVCMNNQDVDVWLGKKVDQIIEDGGFKVKAIAEKTGIPISTLASKRKAYSHFTFSEIYKIARATNTPPSEFIPPQFKSEAFAEGDE